MLQYTTSYGAHFRKFPQRRIKPMVLSNLERLLRITKVKPSLHIQDSFPSKIFFVFMRQKADMPSPKHIRHLTTWPTFCQAERMFHNRELNHQPLPSNLGISPPSSSSLGLSPTKFSFRELPPLLL